MAIGDGEKKKLAMFGAIAGAATPLLLSKVIMPVLNMVGSFTPTLSVKLAEATTNPSIAINVRESLTGINAGLSGWLMDALGFSLNVPYMTYIMGAIGGAILVVVGAMAADALGLLKGGKTSKTIITLLTGGAIASFVLGGFAVPQLGIDLFNTMIAMLVNAAVLSFVFVWLDKQFKWNIVPY